MYRSNRSRIAEVESLEKRRLLSADGLTMDGLTKDTLAAESVSTTKNIEPMSIVGGVESQRGAYPWVVSLQTPFGHFCGGTLVSPDAVVTAAHCVEGQTIAEFSVVVGRENLDGADGKRIDISQIVIHPDYDANTNDSDIAILLLNGIVEAETIDYLDSTEANLARPGVDATVLGWGTTREGGGTVSALREVVVPIVSNATANAPESYRGEITANMLAAGLQGGGRDSCQGDSGGPMVVDNDGTPRLAGVVSWGEGCARADKYGLYTRVSQFANWIDEIVAVDSLGQVNFTQERYIAGSTAEIILQDADLADVESVEVEVEAKSGDRETVTLQRYAEARFRGQIEIVEAVSSDNNQTLEVTGEDEIEVKYEDADIGNGESDSADARARIIVDDHRNNAETDSVLPLGDSAQGEIEFNGDVDWFRYDVVAGQAYEVTVTLNGSLDDSVVAVFASDGETVAGFDDDSGRGLGSQLVYVPRETGIHYAEVSGYVASAGTYQIELREVTPPDDDHSNVVGSSTPLILSEPDSGVIEEARDVDWFSFNAEEGKVYEVNVALDTLLDSKLRLMDSDGRTELAFNDDASEFTLASRIYYRAESSGTRFVEVSGYRQNAGSYDVLVAESDDEHANSPINATEIGEVTSDSSQQFGSIVPQDVDWFSFTATANEFYELRTFEVSLRDTVLSVYDETGEVELAVNDDHLDSLTSRVVWQAPESGLYHVQVAAFQDTSGDYRLNLRRIDPPVDDFPNRAGLASQQNVPAMLNGSIDYHADIDWFAFPSIAGATYTFDVSLVTLQDSLLRVYDSDGTSLLAENDDIDFPDLSSRLEWTAINGGTRYISVSAFDGFLGSYALSTAVDGISVRIPGDVNDDNTVDAQDIDLVFAAARQNSTDVLFDLDGDGQVDDNDADHLIREILGSRPGDVDLDGTVSFADFLVVSRRFAEEGGWSEGDFDGNGKVEFADFLDLASNFGESSSDEIEAALRNAVGRLKAEKLSARPLKS